MPVWLVDFIVKFGWVVFKAIYPYIKDWITKPMTPEDTEKWHEIVRSGLNKEDVKDFQKNRSKPKPSGTTIIKINKPQPKLKFPGMRDK